MRNLASPALPAAALSAGADLPTAAQLHLYAGRYILRGSLVTVAAASNYVLEQVHFAAPWLPWMVMMPLMGVLLSVQGRRQRRLGLAGTTAADHWMRLLQKSFLLITVASLVAAPFVGWYLVHPLMLGLCGLSTWAAGRVLNFRSLRVGGAVCGLLGLAATAVSADTQLLLIAVAMLTSYVVPGYLLRARSQAA